MLLAAGIPLLIVVIVLVRAHREIDDDFVAEWAKAHALTLTDENRPMVTWYLRTARWLRTWGALAGWFLPALVVLPFGAGFDEPGGSAWIFVGYLVGAVYAELSLVRPVEERRRAASLVPRRLEDYLPRRLVRLQRVLGGSIIVLLAIAASVPYREAPALELSIASCALISAGAVAITIALELVERWIVNRPQPYASPTLIAADDAIRSQAVHSVSGSGLAILALAVSALSFQLAYSDVPFFSPTIGIAGAIAGLGALFACLYYGHRAWRVQRPLPNPTGPADGVRV